VPVHGHLGDGRLGNDLVDTGRMEAIALEQAICGFDDMLPLSGGCRGSR